jgi:hypothetical protein
VSYFGTQVGYDRAPHRVSLLLCRPRDVLCDGTKQLGGRIVGIEFRKLGKHRVLVRATRLVRSNERALLRSEHFDFLFWGAP